MVNQIYAIKIGQHQTFSEQGKRLPTTLLRLNDHTVIRQLDAAKDGYSAIQVAIGSRTAKANKPLSGVLKAAKIEKNPRFIKEIRIEADSNFTPGQAINLEEVISVGDTVAVTGTSKGKGFSGVIKRHGFHGGPRTHGQSDRARAPGSIGRGTTPGRVLKGKKMAGRMGNDTVTVKNLKVVALDLENKLLTLSGLVPGAPNGLVTITVTKASPKA